MADIDEIGAAERGVKLALLESIKSTASGAGNAQVIERLAYAYALTVGGAFGSLPGGPSHSTT